MRAAAVILLVSHVFLPMLLVLRLWKSKFSGKGSWLLNTLGSAAFVAYFVLTGRWDWVGYYARAFFPAALTYAAYTSLRRTRGTGWWRTPDTLSRWASLSADFLLATFFGWKTFRAAQGYRHDRLHAVDLSFPLSGGPWYVAHGGSGSLLNGHHADRAQRFALDVTKLNSVGTRVFGVYPSDPTRYAAFGQPIYSPCSGEVVEAEDGLPDLRPPQADTDKPMGNHVAVRCQSVAILLAHLMKGSVEVEPGQEVKKGQPLGRVGNSGNTTEPHLHIHAVKLGSGESILNGEGLPIRFDSRFLVRNDLSYRRHPTSTWSFDFVWPCIFSGGS
jgi:murein DD-endopeptidase MepM/ murein hydrolase activator NlpD